MPMVHTFKVVVLGDSGVGKTSLLTRLVKDEFRGAAATRSTISAAFVNKRIDVDGEAVNLEVRPRRLKLQPEAQTATGSC